MVEYGTLNGYACRDMVSSDIDTVYNMLVPYVTDNSWPDDRNARELKALRMSLKYFVNNAEAIVVKDGDIIVGAFTCVRDKIGNLVNVGNIHSMALLLKVGLCDIQNKHKTAKFQVSNGKIKKIYEGIRTKEGKACTIDALGNGVVSVEAKKEIERLFNALN